MDFFDTVRNDEQLIIAINNLTDDELVNEIDKLDEKIQELEWNTNEATRLELKEIKNDIQALTQQRLTLVSAAKKRKLEGFKDISRLGKKPKS